MQVANVSAINLDFLKHKHFIALVGWSTDRHLCDKLSNQSLYLLTENIVVATGVYMCTGYDLL